jgi:hypothetical protein
MPNYFLHMSDVTFDMSNNTNESSRAPAPLVMIACMIGKIREVAAP